MTYTSAIPYFSADELKCQGTGIIALDVRFAANLPALRERWGHPLRPTSVCRTPSHNAAVGGHPRSMHLTENPKRGTNGTCAADIYWGDWSQGEKLRLARMARSMDWAVGLHDTFCHVDLRRVVGLNPVVFLYGSWSGFSKEEVL